MKKIVLNYVLIMFAVIGLSSCKFFGGAEPETHYYLFNGNDEKWLLSKLRKDDIVSYINSKNEKIVFKVLYSKISYREKYAVGITLKSDGTKRFEFDVKDIALSCISTPYLGEINITIRKFPIDLSLYDKDKIPPSNKVPEQLTVKLRVPKWNYVDYSPQYSLNPVRDAVIKDNICCATPMIINNNTYNQVFTILSGNNQPYNGVYDVNKMLYDKEKGVVGWENIAGEKWMIE